MKQIPVKKCESCPDRHQGEKYPYCRRTFERIKGKTMMCPKERAK